MDEWAVVAKLTKANNRKGGLFTRAVEGLPFLLEEGMEVVFVPPALRVPRRGTVLRIEERPKGAQVFFDTVTDQSIASQLEGHFCLVCASQLPEGWSEPEFPDLSGFVACTLAKGAHSQPFSADDDRGPKPCAVHASGPDAVASLDAVANPHFDPASWQVRGPVLRTEPNPAHPLLVVDTPEGERLVPLVDEFVLALDEDARRILLDPPAGLL